jgi:hypothetical protein
MKTYEDPVVAEIHNARIKLLADAGNSVKAYFSFLREHEKTRERQTAGKSHGRKARLAGIMGKSK